MLTAVNDNSDAQPRSRQGSIWNVIEGIKNIMDDSEDIQIRIRRLGISMMTGGILRFITSIIVMSLVIVQPGSYAHFVKELVAVLIGVTTCWFGVLGGYKHLEYPTRLFFVTELFMMTILSTFLFSVVDNEEVTTNMCNPAAGDKSSGSMQPIINFAIKPAPVLDCAAANIQTGSSCSVPNTTVTTSLVAIGALNNNDCEFQTRISKAKIVVAVFDLIMALFNVMWAMDFNDALNDDAVNQQIDERIRRSKSTGDEFILKALERMPMSDRVPVMSGFKDKLLLERYFRLWRQASEQSH
eukprot:PhF_6_TR21952/c0_g1_i1/m.31212